MAAERGFELEAVLLNLHQRFVQLDDPLYDGMHDLGSFADHDPGFALDRQQLLLRRGEFRRGFLAFLSSSSTSTTDTSLWVFSTKSMYDCTTAATTASAASGDLER